MSLIVQNTTQFRDYLISSTALSASVCASYIQKLKSVKRSANCIRDNCTADDEYLSTPLFYDGIYDDVEMVRMLLEGGADIDSAINVILM